MSASTPLRVFVVDDDPDTTSCMGLLFKHWGHQVETANQGREAIDRAPLLKPHLILVDLGMPDIDGLTVARHLRQAPALDNTFLVACTGYGDQQNRLAALQAGFDEYLVKPLPAQELLMLQSRVQSRVAASQERTSLAHASAIATQELNEKSRRGRNLPVEQPPSVGGVDVAEPILIRVQKSGISELIVLDNRALAERVRQWLHYRGCRVGPVFEPAAGQAAFFSYSRWQTRSLLASLPNARIQN